MIMLDFLHLDWIFLDLGFVLFFYFFFAKYDTMLHANE